MISDTQLLDFEYYLRRMSMFMNEAHGFNERTRILWNVLEAVDNFYNKLFEYYDVLDIEYKKEDKYYDEDITPTGTNSVILDRIGALFDCKRSMMIQYGDDTTPTSVDDFQYSKYITLTNKDYLTYIKMSIKKQFFNGSREELAAIYYAEDLPSNITDYMQFYYVTNKNIEDSSGQSVEGQAAVVDIYWSNAGTNLDIFSTDLRYMFLNGLLTIESMGIVYNKSIQNITNIALFATDGFTPTFGVADPQPTALNFELLPYYKKVGNDYELVTQYDSLISTYYTIANNINHYGVFDFSLWG